MRDVAERLPSTALGYESLERRTGRWQRTQDRDRGPMLGHRQGLALLDAVEINGEVLAKLPDPDRRRQPGVPCSTW